MADLIRNTAHLAGLLLVVVFVTSLLPGAVGGQIQFFAVILMLLAYAGGALFFTAAGLGRAWLFWPDWRRSLSVGAGVPAILLVALLLVVPTMGVGNRLYIWGLVTVGRGWLDEMVAEARRSPDPQERVSYRDGFIPYTVDAGPPVRVAFRTNAGLLDNWAGVVFDPTRRVMEAHGWDREGTFYAGHEVTELFGGDIVECEHLLGSYYYCYFT